MANDLDFVSKHLSNNMIALRETRGLTQSALAELASVPRSTVTYLESGHGNPSLQNLVKIASALQVSIEELLKKPRKECQLIRKEQIPSQKRSGGLVNIFKLLPDPIPGMEIDRMELSIGARMGGVPHIRGTKEYLICLTGQVELAVEGAKYLLNGGDMIAFSGDLPHSYVNPGKTKTECMSVVVLAPRGF